MEADDLATRLTKAAIVFFIICGLGAPRAMSGQETYAARAEAVRQEAAAMHADLLRTLPAGTDSPPPSAAAIDRALGLFASSPLTGNGTQLAGATAGVPSQASSRSTNQALPPIKIFLPPAPPESQAPVAQARAPIQMPGQGGGGAASTPVPRPAELPDPASIPLPPHPPEEQAPLGWGRPNQ